MHKRVQRIATVAILLLLLFLFLVPRTYLDGVCDAITLTAAAARRALAVGGDPADELVRMRQTYERSAGTLRLFLDHGSVDALGMAIVACQPLTEPETLLSMLGEVEAAAAHLKSIESLSTDSIF